ncbi:Holliday junction resolvase [Candidatus Woesearchaeota archaeon]|nr:Holliday junction resolvase [Candidatus Woesearchaeota archaeon]
MSRKAKGTRAERELIHMFWQTEDWSAHRIAGSGSNKYPSPDIISGNNNRILAIECKTLKKGKKYFNSEEIKQLIIFCNKFGAEPWLAIRFDHKPWHFFKPEELENTGSCFAISQDLIKNKGMTFQKLIIY